MARAGSSRLTTTHQTRALLVRRVDYGEADLVVTLFTEQLGRVSVLARGARKSQRRFGGALEPMHTLFVRFDERPGAELGTLREARLDLTRRRLVTSLSAMDVAGRVLGWVRRGSPPRTPEPAVWRVVDQLFGRLDADAEVSPRRELGEAGLALLGAFGWALDFDRCVSCGKPRPEGQAAQLDPARGGLICRACGGARLRLSGPTLTRFASAAAGRSGVLEDDDLADALSLVDQAFRAHAGFD